jgi:hypothetical protein
MKYMLLRFSPGSFPYLTVVFCFTLSGLACAQQQQRTATDTPTVHHATPTNQARERTALVERFATERLAAWQQRLNLEDWNISVAVSRTGDLKPRTLGNIHWDADKKTAVIHVLDPADYKMAFDDILKDIEFTVVHELIHLELQPVLSPLQRNDANRREEEHAVNHMAEALLKLDRAQAAKAPAPAAAPLPTASAATGSAQDR